MKKLVINIQKQSRKYKVIAITILLGVSLITLLNPEPADGRTDRRIRGDKEAQITDDKTLTIVQASPEGKLGTSDMKREIVVVFNHPMVPLAALKEKAKGVFKVTPSLPGKFRWYGSRVIAFIPNESFKPGTKYSISIPKGTKALNGMKLEKSYAFGFSTPELRLYSVYPYRGNRIGYDQKFTIRFNYPVSINNVKKHITITSKGRPYPFKIKYSSPITSRKEKLSLLQVLRRKQSVLVIPAKNFDRDTSVVLDISRGVLPIGGNLGLKKDSQYKFKTYGPLTVDLSGNPTFFNNLYELRFRTNNLVNVKSFAKHVTFNPPVKFRGTHYSNSRYISLGLWDVKPSTKYIINVSGELKDIYGNQLTKPMEIAIKLPRRKKSYYTQSGFSVVESGMKQVFPVNVSGVEKLDVSVGQFSINDLQNYVVSGKYTSKFGFPVKKEIIWKTNLKENQSDKLGFNFSPFLNNKKGWLGIEFDGTVEDWKGRDRIATYKRILQSTDLGILVKESSTGYADVWVHSLTTGKAQRNVMVNSYHGKQHLKSCKTDRNGHCRVKSKIIGNNYTHSSKMIYIAETKNDKAFVLTKEHPMSMWGISQNYNSRAHLSSLNGKIIFDRKLYRPGDKAHVKAFLAVRRRGKLYSDAKSLGDLQVTISNSRGKKVFSRKMESTKQGGLWVSYKVPADAPLGHYTVTIRSLKIKKQNRYSSHTISDTFQVEEFRPVNFTVKSNGFKNSYIDDEVKIRITGKYLFGAAMQNAPVIYTINRKPENLYIPAYSSFSFGDDDYGQTWDPTTWSYYTGASGKLDKKGAFEFSFKMPEFTAKGFEKDKLSRIHMLELEAKVTDVDDKRVTHRKKIMLYPDKTIVGLKTKDRYLNNDEDFEFTIIALKATDKTRTPAKLEVIIHKKEWQTIQTKGPAGSVQRKNTLIRKEVKRITINVKKRPVPFKYRAPEAGNYTITVKTKSGRAYARTNFYAFGKQYVGWDFRDDDSLTLMPDKAQYSPGQKAKILIQSPFKESTAIISVEREGLSWHKTVHLKGNGQPIAIPIKKEYIPNVYVNVVLLRPRVKIAKNSVKKSSYEQDMGRPKLKAGSIKLIVNKSSRRLPLKLSLNKKQYEPGEKVRIKIISAPRSEVTLSVADRGVLDLVAYKFGDPLKKFYDNWPHGVRILENRSSLIKQLTYSNKGKAPGGKGWGNAESKQKGGFKDDSEDGVRKDFRHTAYWNPRIITDKNGVANIEFKLPHNLSTFRVQAMAAKNTKYGKYITEFKVQKPIVLQTLLPRFIRPGDKINIGALVVNQSGETGKFKVRLQSNLLSSTDGETNQRKKFIEKVVTIKNGQTIEVAFGVTVNDKKYIKYRKNLAKEYAKSYESLSGKKYKSIKGHGARLKGRISVEPIEQSKKSKKRFKKNSLKDTIVFHMPIQEQPLTEAFSIAGFTNKKSKEMIQIPDMQKVSPEYGSFTIGLSSTALTGLSRGFSFYNSNPYFCLEQKASAYLLSLTSGELLKSFNKQPPANNGYDFRKIESLFLGSLSIHQNSDGGFRLWKDSTRRISSPYLSAYVLFVLQTLRESSNQLSKNAHFPEKVYKRGIRYLQKYLVRPPKDSYYYTIETIAFIHYVLSREGDANEFIERMLVKEINSLSLRSKSYLALAIKNRTKVENYNKNKNLKEIMRIIKNRMQITTRKIEFNEPVYGSYMRTYHSSGSTLAAVLRVFMELDKKNPLIPQMIQGAVSQKSARAYWSDSHSTGNLAYSLWKYQQYYEGASNSYDAIVKIGQKQVFKRQFSSKTETIYSYSMPLNSLLNFGNQGKTYPLTYELNNGKGRLYYTGTLQYSPLTSVEKERDEGIEVRREIFPVSAAAIRDGNAVKEFKRGKAYLSRITVVNPKPVYYFVLNDPLPSNAEVVNTGFQTESSTFNRFLSKQRSGGSEYRWWMDSSPVYEYRDDRVVVTQEYLSPGVHEYFYIIRGSVKGQSRHPAAQAFGMYEPERFGRSSSYVHIVK